MTYQYDWSPGPATEANPAIHSAFVVLSKNMGVEDQSINVNVIGNIPLDGYALMLGGQITPAQITQTGFEVISGPRYGGNDFREFKDLETGLWTFDPPPLPDSNNSLLMLIFALASLSIFHRMPGLLSCLARKSIETHYR